MTFTPHGKHLIAGDWGAGDATFPSEPAEGPAHDFAVGTPALVDSACAAAPWSVRDIEALSRTVLREREKGQL